jgi:hypothetical protein
MVEDQAEQTAFAMAGQEAAVFCQQDGCSPLVEVLITRHTCTGLALLVAAWAWTRPFVSDSGGCRMECRSETSGQTPPFVLPLPAAGHEPARTHGR